MTRTNISEQNTTSLQEQLEKYARKGFTGKLEVFSTQTKWNLFFCWGRLAWVTGGEHPHRRFRRLWKQHCPQIFAKLFQDFPQEQHQATIGKQYEFLTKIAKQYKLEKESLVAIARSNFQEVLFDILQQEIGENLAYRAFPGKGLDKETLLMSALLWPQQIFPQAHQEWMAWYDAGLQDISPHQAPAIAQPEKLQQMTSPATYQILLKAIDGQRSLRDLAIATSKELWRLGKSLLPYVRQGVIELKTLEDTVGAIASSRQSQTTTTPESKPNQQSKQIYIACIDDSIYIQKQMQHIVTQVGWQFVSIPDSVQALPRLLETSPNLIFLDLVMPVANGYELCAQIRRVKALQSIPVVILTEQDGMFNHARARMVGASSFLSKPIQPSQIVDMVQRYLSG